MHRYDTKQNVLKSISIQRAFNTGSSISRLWRQAGWRIWFRGPSRCPWACLIYPYLTKDNTESYGREGNSSTVGKACMAIFWPSPGFKRKTFDSSGFWTELTWRFAFAVPHLFWCIKNILKNIKTITDARQNNCFDIQEMPSKLRKVWHTYNRLDREVCRKSRSDWLVSSWTLTSLQLPGLHQEE